MLPLLRPGWPLVQRRILLAAQQRGCTQEAIASHLGVSRSLVSLWGCPREPRPMALEHMLGIVELAGDPAVLAPLLEHVGPVRTSGARDGAEVAAELFERVADLTRASREARADGVVDERERAELAARRDTVVRLAGEMAAPGGAH